MAEDQVIVPATAQLAASRRRVVLQVLFIGSSPQRAKIRSIYLFYVRTGFVTRVFSAADVRDRRARRFFGG
jgi:hypothetical protein